MCKRWKLCKTVPLAFSLISNVVKFFKKQEHAIPTNTTSALVAAVTNTTPILLLLLPSPTITCDIFTISSNKF
jgi:hypothetical protein